jgi:hypothetical protein
MTKEEKTPKFIVVTEGSVHIPGDKRSETNPGHGYPAHTRTYLEARYFYSEDELKEWIASNEGSLFAKKRYRAFACTPLTIQTRLEIGVEVNEKDA